MLLERASRSRSSELSLEVIDSLSGLQSLGGEWRKLWEACPLASPFQLPEWQLAWWDSFGQGKELQVVALREEHSGRLVGLLSGFYLPNESKMMLLGAGVSDELDVLLRPGFAGPALQCLFEHLQHSGRRYDLQPLPEHSPLRDGEEPIDVSPVLDLSAELPHRMQQNLAYYRRRAERLGIVRVESATEENFDRLFSALLRLHEVRWEAAGQRGVLRAEDVRRFHRDAARALLARDMLRLFALRIGDRVAATFYGFLCGSRMFYYLGGFDPALAKASPGSLLIAHAIESARRQGATEFGFLRGAESYKYLWGAEDRFLYRRVLEP
jgi:CelD/BcsL family acetyltransferase involved in cellulose biosynthesis